MSKIADKILSYRDMGVNFTVYRGNNVVRISAVDGQTGKVLGKAEAPLTRMDEAYLNVFAQIEKNFIQERKNENLQKD
jgi:hypothetical protein